MPRGGWITQEGHSHEIWSGQVEHSVGYIWMQAPHTKKKCIFWILSFWNHFWWNFRVGVGWPTVNLFASCSTGFTWCLQNSLENLFWTSLLYMWKHNVDFPKGASSNVHLGNTKSLGWWVLSHRLGRDTFKWYQPSLHQSLQLNM